MAFLKGGGRAPIGPFMAGPMVFSDKKHEKKKQGELARLADLARAQAQTKETERQATALSSGLAGFEGEADPEQAARAFRARTLLG